jgi:hypothetical protein
MVQGNQSWRRPDDDDAEGMCLSGRRTSAWAISTDLSRTPPPVGKKGNDFFSQIWEEELELNWRAGMGTTHT